MSILWFKNDPPELQWLITFTPLLEWILSDCYQKLNKNALQSKANRPLVWKTLLKMHTSFTHPAKILCVGVIDMHYFDIDLCPMTLILKLDLDMVATHLHAKN